MISTGAQAIVITANSPTALVPTVEQARKDGIVIVSFDTTVHTDPPDPSLDLGTTVNEDQVEMGRLWAQFLVDQTGGKGKVLMVNGVQGTGVDTERAKGAAEVWKRIRISSTVEVVGEWDPGKAQTVTATALAANPDFVGVWCQGGTDGVVRAFLEPVGRWCRWRARPRTASASRCWSTRISSRVSRSGSRPASGLRLDPRRARSA